MAFQPVGVGEKKEVPSNQRQSKKNKWERRQQQRRGDLGKSRQRQREGRTKGRRRKDAHSERVSGRESKRASRGGVWYHVPSSRLRDWRASIVRVEEQAFVESTPASSILSLSPSLSSLKLCRSVYLLMSFCPCLSLLYRYAPTDRLPHRGTLKRTAPDHTIT